MPKIMTAAEAVKEYIKDGMTVAVNGFVGACQPEEIMIAMQESFLADNTPKNLTILHAAGQGGGTDAEGNNIGQLNHLGEEGMIDTIYAGHYGLAPRIQKLVQANKIAGYNLPQGVVSELFREIAAHRPGVITHVGLGTFIDPRIEGGKLNDKAREKGDYVQVVNFNGEEKLFYPSMHVDVALIRASYCDTHGNCTLEHEGTLADITPIAQAAYNCGGKVIVQVEKQNLVDYGALDTRLIQIPGIYVEAIVFAEPEHNKQTNGSYYNPAFSGEKRIPMSAVEPMKMSPRKVVARRCAMELKKDFVVNLGIGMPEGVASIVAEEGIEGMVLTTESGTIGGVPASGGDFGVTTNPDAILHQSFQFDFYDGGGLDIAFLGLAQCDSHGNINVSKFGPKIAGCGGFINITQNTPVVVYCGTFTTGGLKTHVEDGKLVIDQEGKVVKFLKDVEQITFSGEIANKTGQKVLYITERCVFQLTPEGLELTEVAPGVDIEKDILALMEFKPVIKDVKPMDARIFTDALMGLAE
jgi:propionate CoA-transferase